ncbi:MULTISPECIES: OsmC family protein [Pseudoalteromonas]|uniref:OsmC family protein n=1 Tax=Pseudoalteromonas undina TaxID=43660 RepID=A0ACC6QZE0_9GAMM|nr:MULTISPECIES: OsmC family protein [unclassified Pseudoalteromonas]KPZ58499.1 OsmC-like protein [Pseudoalteromonas sp. P1-25]KPZ60700.1 OsmC-like protein [Pseudoalteromonas sp. P1-13-1a]KPZ63082.1 OsmC-like protein [Pseudoalteromonas sp. P1-7a]
MEISVSLLDGQKQRAKFGSLEVISDQSINAGGGAEHPEPFDYFLVSMVLCAGFYARKFCEQREISTEGMTLTQNNESIDEEGKKLFSIEINLPDGFPQKYKKALIAAVNTCTVKKVIQAQPEFSVVVK